MKNYIFLVLGIFVFFPFTTEAIHTLTVPQFDSLSAYEKLPSYVGYCNYSKSDSKTFSDGPYRLLYSVYAGGMVERDDTWAAHLTVNGETSQLYTYGNCKCSTDPESGCAGTDNVYWLPIFQDSGSNQTDTVTVTGDANNKAGFVVAFQGYQTMTRWKLCDAKQVAINGACRDVTGNIESDKTSCGVGCSPRISWSSEFAENVFVKKNGSMWLSGPQNNGFTDYLSQEGTNTYVLYGTASNGNNAPQEFELDRVEVNVRPFNSPTCTPSSTTPDQNSLVIFTASQGDGSNYSWEAPNGIPDRSTVDTRQFSTSYNTTGTKTVTVTSAGLSGECSIEVRPSVSTSQTNPKLDLKINNSDGPVTVVYPAPISVVWTSSNVSNCIASGDTGTWSGPKQTSGSFSQTQSSPPNQDITRTWTLTCTTLSGSQMSDSVVVTLSPPPPGFTCGASVSPMEVNVGDEVTFNVWSSPTTGHRYSWHGTDPNGNNVNDQAGSGQNGVERYRVYQPGTYTRWVHVEKNGVHGACDSRNYTGTIALVVKQPGDDGGGGGGNESLYYGCTGATDTSFGFGTGCSEYSSYISPTKTPYRGSAGQNTCMQNCEPEPVKCPPDCPPPPPPPPQSVTLKAATNGRSNFGGDWHNPFEGKKPLKNVDLWASPGISQSVANQAVAYRFYCNSGGTITTTLPVIQGTKQAVALDLCNYDNTGSYTAKAVALGHPYFGPYCGWFGNYGTPFPCTELGDGTVAITVTPPAPPPQDFTITNFLWSIQSGTPRYRADYDYDNNTFLNKTDADILAQVAGRLQQCPQNKNCDVNNSNNPPDPTRATIGDAFAYSIYLQTYNVQVNTNAASNAKANISLSSSGGATVSFTSNAPSGYSVFPSSVVVSGNNGSAELRLPTLRSERSYSITVTGTAGGGTTRTSSPITLNVTAPVRLSSTPDFSLNKLRDVFVNVVGTQPVTSNSSKITVSVFDGFSSNVNLSVQSVSPALPGARFNFSDSSLTPSEFATGSDFTVTIPSNTAPGVYTIKIQGADGGLVRTTRDCTGSSDCDIRLNVNTRDPSFREI